MQELHDIVNSYWALQPAASLLAGATVGAVTRLYQRHSSSTDIKSEPAWMPGSIIAAILIAAGAHGGAAAYATDIAAALCGDYLASRIVDHALQQPKNKE